MESEKKVLKGTHVPEKLTLHHRGCAEEECVGKSSMQTAYPVDVDTHDRYTTCTMQAYPEALCKTSRSTSQLQQILCMHT